MSDYRIIKRAAIFPIAVLCISMSLGCFATQRDAAEIKHQIRQLEETQAENQKLVQKMDSLVTAGAEADNKLRNELRYSMDEMGGQIEMLLQNYNDLMQRIDALGRQEVTHVLRPSSGSQMSEGEVPDTAVVTEAPIVRAVPSINCDSTYDESFILLRQNEYESAIAGFESFLANCEGHENIANGHFWLGQCFYLTNKYNESIAQYEKILSDYQDWPDMSQVYFKIARNKEEQGKIKDARELYNKIIEDYPGTFDAQQSEERLKDL